MVNFQGKKWELAITRNTSFFHASFDVGSGGSETKIFGTQPHRFFYLVLDGHQASIFNDHDHLKQYYKRLEQICSSRARFKKLEQVYKKYGELLLKASDKLEKNFSHRNYKLFADAYMCLAPGLFLTSSIGRHIYRLLVQRATKLFPDYSTQQIEILIGDITYPSGHTPLTMSQFSLLKIGALLQKLGIKITDIKRHPEIYERLQKYLKLYAFIPVNFNEEPWSERDILLQLKTLLLKNCVQELQNLQTSHRQKVRLTQSSLKKIKDRKTVLMAIVLQKSTLLNEYRKYCFCRASLAYRPLFRAIAKKYHLSSWKECWKLTQEEVERLYYHGDKSILKKLPGRRVVALTFNFKTKKLLIHTGSALKPFLAELDHKKIGGPINYQGSEIKGVIGNPGIIRGVAKIIRGRYDFHKFKGNDIIVAAMTSVDFVPLMKRASAFVTNEGGITSHASIVSREMNKPCIIGTKIGTKVLKDGDLIEVDAIRGVVKILKRK